MSQAVPILSYEQTVETHSKHYSCWPLTMLNTLGHGANRRKVISMAIFGILLLCFLALYSDLGGVGTRARELSLAALDRPPCDDQQKKKGAGADDGQKNLTSVPQHWTERFTNDKFNYARKKPPSEQYVRKPKTKRRLPKALVIGIRKSGTRALLEFLSLHPEVRSARPEIHFFDREENYERGFDWYRRQMPYSYKNQITLEKSPAYFTTAGVAERVRAMDPAVKLLLIVRDPVSRAVSDYLQLRDQKLSKGKYPEDFESLAIDPFTGDVNSSYRPIKRSIYHKYMRKWLRFFKREQILIVDGNELARDPLPELRKVEIFLGLKPYLSRHHFHFDEEKGFYCLNDTPDSPHRCLAPSKGRPHPYVSRSVLHKLYTYFAPHNQEFFTMVGRTFDWAQPADLDAGDATNRTGMETEN